MKLPRLNYKNLGSMQTVEEIYKLMLNRNLDATGRETWLQAIKAGEYTRYKQIKLIARSDEFLVTFDNISRSERLRRALSMLSLLKMERATPMQQSELVYRFILNRAIDDVGAKSCAKRINQFWFSPLVLVARLMRSAEFKQPYFKRTPLQQLHRARMLWVQQLPPAKTILDIGGNSPNVPEGALIEMGYPHRPEKLIIFDKPPHEQYRGTPKEFAALLSAAGFTINQQWAILDMPNVVSSGTYGIKDFYSGEPLSTTSDNGYCFAMACEYDIASVFNNISSTISLFSSIL